MPGRTYNSASTVIAIDNMVNMDKGFLHCTDNVGWVTERTSGL